MSKRKKPENIDRGGWARYRKRLPSTRVSDEVYSALGVVCERKGMRVSDYMRNALEIALYADGAQIGTHIVAQSTAHANEPTQI